jgi:hypothetical protein
MGARQRARLKDVYENRERCMLDNAGLLMGLAFGALRIDTIPPPLSGWTCRHAAF